MDGRYQRGDVIDVVNGRMVWWEDEVLWMTVSVTGIWTALVRVVGVYKSCIDGARAYWNPFVVEDGS